MKAYNQQYKVLRFYYLKVKISENIWFKLDVPISEGLYKGLEEVLGYLPNLPRTSLDARGASVI